VEGRESENGKQVLRGDMRVDTGRCREKYQTREIEDTGLEVVSLCRVFLTHTAPAQSNMFVCFYLLV